MLVQACYQANNLRLSEELLGVMIRKNICLSISSYRSWMCLMCSAGRYLSALSLKEFVLGQSQPDTLVIYNIFLFYLLSAGNILAVNKVLNELQGKGLPPNEATNDFLAYGFSKCREALELSREMESRGWIHGSVVQYRIVGGLLSHVDLLNIMLKRGNLPDSTSYDSVIHGFCACNKLNPAMNFHNEMLDWDLKPSINTWDMLVCKIFQDGHTAEAERLLISMVRLGQTPIKEMYTSVIDRYRPANNPKKASELMQMMQESSYQPDFDTHWSVISNLSNSKDNNNSSQDFLSRLLSGSGFT
ncbi:hypothetical protein CRYUN_Cryun24cG0099600 [Craigia yunnanensis]